MMRACRKALASHVPTRTPLVLPLRPPLPPQPPKPAPSSSAGPSKLKPKDPSSPAPSILPKPRLDYIKILGDPTSTTRNHLLRKSGLHPDHVAHIQRLRDTQILLLQKLHTIRAKQKDIGELIRTKLGDTEEALRQAKKLKTRVGEYESTLGETETELLELGLALPNFSHSKVPLGPEDNAVVIEEFGPPIVPADSKRDHLGIANHWDWLDNEASTISTGSSWPYLKGVLAMLEIALIQYSLSIAIKHGFTPVIPPDVIKGDIAWRCGFAPRDSGESNQAPTQTYHLNFGGTGNNGLCLAGTAEIPLAALFADKIIPREQLPKKVVGVGHAFRAEAGARGADTRGLYRVHQFTKVELFCVTDQEGSEGMMEELRAVQREIAQGLGLSVRVLDMPTEELGASASRKYDMEAWMPGRGKWGEITSTSNCTDYQSRRLHIRYRSNTPNEGDTLPFAHTLNGTAAAIPRLLVALVENRVELSEKGEPLGLKLPKGLERYWLGSRDFGEGKKRGRIEWV